MTINHQSDTNSPIETMFEYERVKEERQEDKEMRGHL